MVVGCNGNRGVGSGSGLCMQERASSASGFLLEKEHSLSRQHRHTLDLFFLLSWCTHPRIRELVDGHPPALLLPRQLMELPQDYTVLVKQLSTYRWGRDRQEKHCCVKWSRFYSC